MSLINEALKKAQKQRTGESPAEMPAVGGESAARIARRGRSQGVNTLILWIGVGVAALAIVITGTVMIMRSSSSVPASPVPPATTAAVPAAPAVTTPKPAETPVVAAPVATAPAPSVAVSLPTQPSTPPVQTAPAATAPATTVLFPTEAPKPAEPAAVQIAPAPVQPAAPAVARKLDPRAIKFINSIRVAGIRASANDSKVLMNDRVYRVGDTVEAEMGLKLAGITPSSLTFEDENGARFTRNF